MCMDILLQSLCIPERGLARGQRRRLSLERVNDLVKALQTETAFWCQRPCLFHCSEMLIWLLWGGA